MAEEVTPKNILMIGPTGVGKTEIARRLARLAQSPFIKVEASKFTEVGYVGRDVESMVRDLVELAVDMVRAETERREVKDKAREAAEERLLDLLLPPPSARRTSRSIRRRRPYPGGSTRSVRASRPTGRASACAISSAPAGSTTGSSSSTCRRGDAVVRGHRRHVGRRDRRQPQGHDGQHVRRPVEDAAAEGAARRSALIAEESAKLVDMESVSRGPRCSASSRRASSSSTRSTRSPAATAWRGRRPWARRQPRGRAARHPADRRGHDRQYQARDGQDRSHPLHRRRRVPRVEAVRT